jgi:hypothetical protein
MQKAILGSKSVPRVEIDQRARDARLRLEQIERLFVPRAVVTVSRLRPVRYLLNFPFNFGSPRVGSRTRRTRRGLLNNRQPRMPHEGWVQSAP